MWLGLVARSGATTRRAAIICGFTPRGRRTCRRNRSPWCGRYASSRIPPTKGRVLDLASAAIAGRGVYGICLLNGIRNAVVPQWAKHLSWYGAFPASRPPLPSCLREERRSHDDQAALRMTRSGGPPSPPNPSVENAHAMFGQRLDWLSSRGQRGANALAQGK